MYCNRLGKTFFSRDVLYVAPVLIGKTIVRKFVNGEIKKYRITETEAYRGEEDLACHASKGRTARTEVMYADGGLVYVYLIYGMYWLLNVVTSSRDFPAAVLIRGIEDFSGPGRVGRELQIDKTFYGEDLSTSDRIWIEGEEDAMDSFLTSKRVGVDYAGVKWSSMKWRFQIKN